MRFTRLALSNFRSHVNTTIDFDQLTFIRGGNASGKSTIEKAFQITLGGQTEETTADGKGSVGLIRRGEKKAKIDLLIDVGEGAELLVQCALNGTARDVLATSPTNPNWTKGADFLAHLQRNREVLSCLLNNRFFVDQSEDKQKDILSAMVLPKSYAWPEWVVPSANSLGLKIDWSLRTAPLIANAGTAAFKERTNINRDVKNFKMPEGDTSAAANLEDFTERLNARRSELEAAVADLAKKREGGLKTENLRQAARTRMLEAQNRILRDEQSVSGLDGKLLAPAILKKHEAAAKNVAKAKSLEGDLLLVDAERAAAKKAMDAVTKLEEGSPCPTCGVPISEETAKAILQPLVDSLNTLTERRESIIKERKALGDPEAAAKAVAEHKQAAQDMERAKQRIAEEQLTVKDAEAKLDELGKPVTEDFSAEENAIADLRTKIQKGTDAVNAARSAKDLLARIDTAGKDRAKLLTQQKEVEALVKYFGETVTTELLAQSIGAFTDKMNAVLENWGYQCQVSVEPYVFAIVFRGPDGNSMPIELKHLSKSQRYRFALAFQVALAITSGFKFVVVDEADIYDANEKGGLLGALAGGELEQAVIIGTDLRETTPDMENARFYLLEDTAERGDLPTTVVRELGA